GVVYFLILRDKPAQTQPMPNSKEPVIQLLRRIIVNKQAWALSLFFAIFILVHFIIQTDALTTFYAP
ncbi:hypothetical protein MXD98_16745, partial [Legionella pneumophila]|nr:hypothetical protein [Legionella pneumophila]